MKILVTYYSRTGNTKKVAISLAEKLNCEIEEIVDLKNRSGLFWFFSAIKDALTGSLTKIETNKNPKDYDVVIIGTPIWAASLSPAVRTYISKYKKGFKEVAIFTTSGDIVSEKLLTSLEEILNKKIKCYTDWISEDFKENKKYQEKLDKFVEEIKNK